ncbi:MAG TPA: hypothetical protein VGD78_18265 [Chthoniobacterales bacterium]
MVLLSARLAFLTGVLVAVLAAGPGAHAQGIQQQLDALKAQVGNLQTSNAALQRQVDDLHNEVRNLQTTNATLRNQLAAIQTNPVLALGSFVAVNPGPELDVAGPNITFSGANLHIVSGSGATNDNLNPRGLGNLIVGYNEDPAQVNQPLGPGDRGGSHNLVVGSYHRFTRAAFGGLVAGEQNTISNEAASVSGGFLNSASDLWASVTGGLNNRAARAGASVTGGQGNTADGPWASVTGGHQNTADGQWSGVTGGFQNTASGTGSTVVGGTDVTGVYNFSVLPQPPFP